ncbi:uncharacterized protein RBU47_013791 [Passerculus sandwichensis]
MRRWRGGGAAPAEACGVWLDTAELKRGRARRSWGRGRDKPWVSPAGTAPGAGTALPCPRAGAGGTNPAPGAAPSRVCCSPQSPGPAQPLRERGQLRAGPCRESRDRDRARLPLRATPSPPEPPELGSEPLFTQDSEGNRVIKHW